jgi:hypothetical protein
MDVGPTDEFWWECDIGSSKVFVVATGPLEAQRKAEAQLRDLGVLPGGPPGLHESFERMCEFATQKRRPTNLMPREGRAQWTP